MRPEHTGFNRTVLCIAALVACGPREEPKRQTSLKWENYCIQERTPMAYTLDAPCEVGTQNPKRLLVTTTDFSSGALSLVHIYDKSVETDIALGSTDAIPFYLQGKVFVVHRFGQDYIDVFDPTNKFRWLAQHALMPVTFAEQPELSANPHALSLRSDGVGFVSLYGAPAIQLFDFQKSSGEGFIGNIDMSAFGVEKSKTRLSLSFSCDNVLFTSVQRLDLSFAPVTSELLVPVDMQTCTPYPLDLAITLLGKTARQVRLDSRDDTGHTVLILTQGLEAIDLSEPSPRWVIPPTLFQAQGISRFHLQSFAIHQANQMLYFAAYAEDYSQVHIWRVPLNNGQALTKVLSGFNAVEKVLEIVGDELWVGDTTIGASGLRAFELSGAKPVELIGPLSTGLAPYSMIAIP